MRRTWGRLAAVVVFGLVAANGYAAVLCTSRSGSGTVRVRIACRANETPLDPVALGLQGPGGLQGPAGPGLVVKDANGSVVGAMVSPSVRFNPTILNSRDGGPAMWVVRMVAGTPASFGVTAAGFADVYATVFFSSTDCTGPPLLEEGPSFIIAETAVRGTSAYVVTGAPFQQEFHSYSVSSSAPCYVNQSETRTLSAATVVDLSSFGLVPPFHAEMVGQ